MHAEGTDWRIRAHRRYRLEDTCTQKVQAGGYVHTEGTGWRIHAHRRYRLEDTCTQKVQAGGYVHTEGTDWRIRAHRRYRLVDGREGGQGATRTVEPWSSSKIVVCYGSDQVKSRQQARGDLEKLGSFNWQQKARK